MVPTHMFLTRGVGVHREKLASFEEALRSAGVAYCNLVSVSSILPPNCKIIPRKRGENLLNPGEITYCVMARSETNETQPVDLRIDWRGDPQGRHKNLWLSLRTSRVWGNRRRSRRVHGRPCRPNAGHDVRIDFDPGRGMEGTGAGLKMGGEIVRTQNITPIGYRETRSAGAPWWPSRCSFHLRTFPTPRRNRRPRK